MNKERMDFCVACRKETPYELRKEICTYTIKEKEYQFEITKAYCKECGEELLLPGMLDQRAQEIDRQYREAEDIVSVEDIQKLMELYNIGKAPLSLALGFGEITITRYLQGQVPSKEYSDIIKRTLHAPKFMITQLQKNAEKIGDTAYRKAMDVAEKLAGSFEGISQKMLSSISYIFEKTYEITPLALQKILYFIQALHMTFYGKPLYEEDCQAWVHGPVYEKVYELFKDFRYNPIEDHRFVIFKHTLQELTGEEKHVIDLVLATFGLYSGKALETITHAETPWQTARKGYLPEEPSHEVISKAAIKTYFERVHTQYNLKNEAGIQKYIHDTLLEAQ